MSDGMKVLAEEQEFDKKVWSRAYLQEEKKASPNWLSLMTPLSTYLLLSYFQLLISQDIHANNQSRNSRGSLCYAEGMGTFQWAEEKTRCAV